jgi:lipid-binding SYLF domain-containing protein
MTRQISGQLIPLFLIAMIALAGGCQAPQGNTIQEKQTDALNMRDTVLQELYAERPEAKAKVARAAGYGVFTNVGSKIFVLATGNGFGVVHNNRTGEDTYMKMVEVGGGLGIGVKKYKAVFIFNDGDAMETFLNSGWEFGGDADAAAKAGDSGGAAGAQGTSGQLDGLEVYTFTDAGIALSATAAGTKYYRDDELN